MCGAELLEPFNEFRVCWGSCLGVVKKVVYETKMRSGRRPGKKWKTLMSNQLKITRDPLGEKVKMNE